MAHHLSLNTREVHERVFYGDYKISKKGKSGYIPCVMEQKDDGSVVLHAPNNIAPDTLAYNLQKAGQLQKVNKMKARLRAKLAARQ